MSSAVDDLKKEITRLKAEKDDREAALPSHSVRTHQMMAIEELEEEIEQMEQKLKTLEQSDTSATE